MDTKLNRKDKIRLLNGLKTGKTNIKSLFQNKVYFISNNNKNKEIYIIDKQEFTFSEYKAFCDLVLSKNNNSIFWLETKTYY